MTLRLTPDMLAAGYDFLRETQPFKGWKLPDADEIGFAVVKDTTMYADFCIYKDEPLIRVSEKLHGHTVTLLATTAHEMIHLYQHIHGLDRGGEHNADFKRRAAKVCAVHGFDPRTF